MTRCNDKVTEQLVSDTFYKVDKAVYRHLRDVYSYPERHQMSKQLWERDQLRETPISFDRKGRVVKGGSPVLKSNNMIMVKPTGSRRKNDFPAPLSTSEKIKGTPNQNPLKPALMT